MIGGRIKTILNITSVIAIIPNPFKILQSDKTLLSSVIKKTPIQIELMKVIVVTARKKKFMRVKFVPAKRGPLMSVCNFIRSCGAISGKN
jgi:hypothetical protein